MATVLAAQAEKFQAFLTWNLEGAYPHLPSQGANKDVSLSRKEYLAIWGECQLPEVRL